jgi:hypothetical protein
MHCVPAPTTGMARAATLLDLEAKGTNTDDRPGRQHHHVCLHSHGAVMVQLQHDKATSKSQRWQAPLPQHIEAVECCLVVIRTTACRVAQETTQPTSTPKDTQAATTQASSPHTHPCRTIRECYYRTHVYSSSLPCNTHLCACRKDFPEKTPCNPFSWSSSHLPVGSNSCANTHLAARTSRQLNAAQVVIRAAGGSQASG